MSGARVWRIEAEGQRVRYLKHATGARGRELGEERERLAWLRERLPVPVVTGWAQDDAGAWLLLGALQGAMAHETAGEIPALVRALGEGLRRVHALPSANCPFDMRLGARLTRAALNIEAGLVDEENVRAANGVAPDALLRQLEAARPLEPSGDLVVVHGDYCLPNLLITLERSGAPRVSGYLDWGRAGISDRYLDLAIGARTLRHNLGPGWESLFFMSYGLPEPDRERLAWYETLDELY
jgi:aminoglycoside phosphotransferase